MRLPPSDLLRDTPPPEDLLLVVRGGEHSLTDAVLERTTGDCWRRYLFFGVSVFGAPGDDLVALSVSEPAIRRRPALRLARCGDLRAGGFEVCATFANPAHYSVVLAERRWSVSRPCALASRGRSQTRDTRPTADDRRVTR
jgi:hypothetical protein